MVGGESGGVRNTPPSFSFTSIDIGPTSAPKIPFHGLNVDWYRLTSKQSQV